MKIIVTGCNGFIGTALVKRLEKEHEVLALGRSYDVGVEQEYPKVDLIIHLAAMNSSKESVENPREYFRSNVMGAFNILEECRRTGAKLMYLTTVKSIEKNPYGASKACAELWIHAYRKVFGLNVILNRVGNLYGPGGDQFFVNQFVMKASKGEKITIFGDGSDRRTILHIDDLIELLVDQVNNFEAYSTFPEITVSGGSDNSLTVKELLNYIEAENVEYTKAVPGQEGFLVTENGYSRTRGWVPKIDWKTGVHNLTKHYA